MNNEEKILQELKELKERREQRGRGGRRGGHGQRAELMEKRAQGAKTFRRKRALSFLENLETKRETLKSQLETPELQSINQILVGELKATETIINEFVQAFELYATNEDEKETTPANKED